MKHSNNTWEILLRHPTHTLFFDNLKIIVHDNVFTPNPEFTYTPSIILENLPDLKNKMVLDVGAGTGVLGLTAAIKGAQVVLTDIDDYAISNITENIELNRLQEQATLLKTNLLNDVHDKFDYVFANLPIENELWGTDTKSTVDEFLGSVQNSLKVDAEIYFPWGSFADDKKDDLERLFKKYGFFYEIRLKECIGYIWYLYILKKK